MVKVCRMLVVAFALAVPACSVSVLGGGVKPAPAASVEEREQKAALEMEKNLTRKVAKLLAGGATEEQVLEILVATGQTEPGAKKLIALARLN